MLKISLITLRISDDYEPFRCYHCYPLKRERLCRLIRHYRSILEPAASHHYCKVPIGSQSRLNVNVRAQNELLKVWFIGSFANLWIETIRKILFPKYTDSLCVSALFVSAYLSYWIIHYFIHVSAKLSSIFIPKFRNSIMPNIKIP
jgi:hypothetical protein